MQIQQKYSDTLPQHLHTMREKGKPTVWLPRALALQFARFRGHQNDRHFMMVDYDKPHHRAHQLYDLEPNIICYNPEKYTHQAFWLLSDPVHCHPEARQRAPYRYLRAIESAHDVKYGCDPKFARYIHRNPLHHAVDTDWRHDESYTLNDLAAVVDLNQQRVYSGNRASDGQGRNATLFDELRHWAYRNALESRSSGSYDDWHRAVVTRALSLNAFSQPLNMSETLCVAKSVAEFTFFRYQPEIREITPEYRKIQAERGRKGGKISKGGGRPSNSKLSRNELIQAVYVLKKQGLNNRGIAEDLKISASTVSAYLKLPTE